MAANQVDFKILPSDQFSVYSPATRSDKVITYFTLLSKLRGDILSVGQDDDPNNIVSAFYINTGNVQTLHLVKADGSEVTASNSFAGTVTSVDMSVPTGFSISGNPITTSGTLAVGFASGYSLPTNAIQATWTTAYNRSLTSAAVTGTSTKTLTLNQQDGGTITASWSDIDTGLTSVGLTMPAAFSVANSPLTANGTLAVTAAGLSSQYIRGDGQLANFPTPGGGGSSVNYYLNGSVSQGTFGGVTYYELSKTPVAGAGTNFTRTSASGDGYVASFITDANDPDQINIPGGNWNLEFYFNSSSSGGSPAFYGELYKVSVSNVFTLIASGSANSEVISGGTSVDQYYTSIAVPQTALLATDRLAIRVYVIVSGKNITLHTENSNFSEVITTFSTGLNSLNGLSDQVQYFAVGTSGTDFAISSSLDTHTFNLPTASATNRGALSSADWTTFNGKASDAFKTIAVTGQSNIVADSATDTLTFEAGSNIIITTDAATDKITITAVGGGSGSVTSVDMSVPTGFAISGNPITTSGTLALAFASGYSLPTNASQSNWDTAYNNSITAFSYNTSTGVLTLTQQDAGTLTATVTLQPFTTDNLTQGSTNLYDKVVSLTGAGTTVVTGTYPNFTITSNDQHVGTVTSIATSAPITGGTITTSGTIGITQSGASADGYLSSTDWNTFNSKVGGSGTVNYVSKWTSTGAIGNSQIFDSGTYVGINTATPAAKLDISGAHVASIGLLRLNSSAANVAAQTYYIDGAYKAATYAGTDDNFYILGRDADIVFSTTSSTTTRMVITNGGNVGIGTAAPNNKLSVIGNIEIQSGGSKIGFNVNDAFSAYGTSVAHYGISYGLTANPLALSGYFGVGVFTSGTERMRIDGSGNVGIGTTSPSRLLHVAGNAQVDGWIFQGGYYTGSITIPGPSANYGNGRVYLRLCSSASGRIMTAKVRISSTWNWAPAFGSVEADISFYWTGSSMAYAYVNILSATGQAATNLTFGALEIEGGSVSVPIYSVNTNPIYAYIQLSPDADPSQVSYSTWSSVAFPGQANVYVQTSLGVGTPSPSALLHVNGTFRSNAFFTLSNGVSYWGPNGVEYGYLTWDTGYARVGASGSNTLYLGGSNQITILTGGNVGIGETSPTQKLHITGNVRVSGAYYDSSNAAGTSGQILSSTGTGTAWISPGGGGGIITGSGTTNYVTKWTGSSAVGNSQIFDNGTSVGIGTTAPSDKLHVAGGILASFGSTNGYVSLQPGNATVQGFVEWWKPGPARVAYMGYNDGVSANNLGLTLENSANLIINGGNVGIGTTAPASILHVSSTGANTYSSTITKGSNMKGIVNTLSNNADDMVGIYFGTGTDAAGSHWSGITGSRSNSAVDWGTQLNFYTHDENTSSITTATQKMVIKGSGNVGIGTTAPLSKVQSQIEGNGSALLLVNAAGGGGAYVDLDFNTYSPYQSGYANPGASIRVIDDGAYSGHITFRTKGAAIGAAQSERMRITSAGNVGIGITSVSARLSIASVNGSNDEKLQRWVYYAPTPTDYYLDLKQTVTSAVVRYNFSMVNAGTAYNDVLVLDRGNVGIGITDPSQKLHVSGNIRVTGAYYDSANGAGTSGQILSSTGTGTAWIAAPSGGGVSGSGTTNYVTKWTSGSAVGNSSIFDNGNVGIGTTAPEKLLHISGGSGNVDNLILESAYVSAGVGVAMQFNRSSGVLARIRGIEEGSWNGGLLFEVRSGNTYPGYNGATNVAMKIATNGNVGIGTTAPESLLHLSQASTGGDGAFLFIDNPASSTLGNTAGIRFATNAGASFSGYGSFIQAVNTNAGNGAESLTFGTWNGAARGERMRIDSSGSVGINTTNPGYKLDVIGSVRSYGGLFSNGYHADTYIENLLPAANNGAGQGDVQLRMWCSEPEITWSWAGFGYNVKNDGASPYGFGRVNTSFGQAYMRFSTDGNLYFYNANTSGTRVETMTLTNAGNVGIGTTTPGSLLQVGNAGAAPTGLATLTLTGANTAPQIATKPGLYHRHAVGLGVFSDYAMSFQVNGSSALSDAMYITNTGNVGINTTVPAEKLSVVGNIRSAGNVIASVGLGYGNYISMRHDDVNGYITITRTVYAGNLILEPYANVGISTTNPSYKLDVSGTIRATGDVIAYSDARVKENVETLDGALDKVMKMRGVSYNKIGEQEKKVGVIAQEILEVLPEVVSQDETGTYSVAYGNISAVLIEAIKELTNTVKEQQKQIDELKSKLK